MIAGVKYYAATGPLTGTRDTESHKNIIYGDGDAPWETAVSNNGNLVDRVVASARTEIP